MARVRPREDGFTIVELMVASFVLIVGMLGVLALFTGALRTTTVNITRVGATNLARELVERTRGLDYDDMTGTLVKTRLQAAGLGSGSPWTITRRGVDYTITASSCTYDDPADGLASTPPDNVCTPQPSGATGDSNGEDFRRTTFRLDWVERGGVARSATQSTLVVNPSGGLGPRITNSPVVPPVLTNVSSVDVTWTTTPATTLRWVVDDGGSSGSSTGSTSFTTNWNIGVSGNPGEVLDGAYQISAQAFDDRDIAGEAKRVDVLINRRVPYAPPSLAGGHDTRAGDWVDLQWTTANAERDVIGYRVKWVGPDGIINGNDTQVCPSPGVTTPLDAAITSCTDLNPPSGATTYYVVAVDRDTLNNDTPREGDRRALVIAAPGARLNPPSGLTATASPAQTVLTWTAPASGSVAFYRIYRDGGVNFTDRFGRTGGSTATFTDDSASGTSHKYWVTAVDSTYNESDPSVPLVVAAP